VRAGGPIILQAGATQRSMGWGSIDIYLTGVCVPVDVHPTTHTSASQPVLDTSHLDLGLMVLAPTVAQHRVLFPTQYQRHDIPWFPPVTLGLLLPLIRRRGGAR
jgi:hypothetical protein